MKRISRIEQATMIARVVSMRATCKRRQVGAILVRDGRIIATGYNGPAPGEKECNDSVCDLTQSCKRSIHAEQNLISFCAKNGISTNGCQIVLTLSPCVTCARLIISSGIKKIVYIDEYRDTSGIEFARKQGVDIAKYVPTNE